jgi:four helix bundle protein
MKFSVEVAGLCEELRLRPIAWNTAGQLLDASTSMAANYRATCRARSRAEWISKPGTVAEEADESVHWLEFVLASNFATSERVTVLLDEARELRAISPRHTRRRAGTARSADR